MSFLGTKQTTVFGDVAGRDVDDVGAGLVAHRDVSDLVGQAIEVHAELADGVAEFCRHHRDVDVVDAVMREFFEFLGRTRHDEDDKDVLVVLVDFLGEDVAEEGGAYFLRGLATR